jgi:23S rRNA pseudouridine2605 synthase
MKEERLAKIIANAGIASRRKAEELIVAGRVTMNGKVVKELGRKADIESDAIAVDGQQLALTDHVYIALNKPRGYIATRKDTHERKTVFDLLPKKYQTLHTIGRLDKETSGLLLFTNDGDFTNQVTHPRYEIRKRYQVTVRGAFSDEAVGLLQKGFRHPEFDVSPCSIEDLVVDEAEDKTRFILVIGEGKKREIRKIIEFLNYELLRLHRIQIGGYALQNIPMGTIHIMTKKEVAKVIGEEQ